MKKGFRVGVKMGYRDNDNSGSDESILSDVEDKAKAFMTEASLPGKSSKSKSFKSRKTINKSSKSKSKSNMQGV